MVIGPGAPAFRAEALRIGRRIAELAVRDGGRATWVAADRANVGSRRVYRTLGADLAGGTAGVGWFLARLAAVTGDVECAALAADTVRAAIDRCPTLVDARRCGWYRGALGVAWAAIDGGMALADEEMTAAGVELAESVTARLDKTTVTSTVTSTSTSTTATRLALVGGSADVLAGLLAVADATADAAALDRFAAVADRLVASVRGADLDPSRAPGLARGTSGLAVVLDAWAAATGRADDRVAAQRALSGDRQWYEPAVGWYATPGHDQQPGPYVAEWSWCGGAAGIGLAHLAAFTARREVADLADLTAAVETVRAGLVLDDGSDPSLCHGASGGIELLLSAGSALGEPGHVGAAQRAGDTLRRRLIASAGADRDDGPGGEDPSLLYGLAGIGLLMLRLADPASTISPALPPFLVAAPDAGGARRQPGGRSGGT